MQVIPKIRHWNPVTRLPALSPGGVHVWKIHTGPKGALAARSWPLLSHREWERARRLRFDHIRERYVRAQAGLRMILSRYLGITPHTIEYEYASAGKPLLKEPYSGLEFNLTTSGDLALVGLSVCNPIGVDCEQVRNCRDVVAIARRMFAPEAASAIVDAAPEDRLEQFYLGWTALEAEVKMDGRGLVGRQKPAAQGSLRIEHCVPEPGFIAAVAREHLPPVEEWVTMELPAG